MKKKPKGNAVRCKRTVHSLQIKPLVLQMATAITVLYGGAFLAPPVSAAPTGGQVVAGTATIHPMGNTTLVQQNSQRAVLNWQNFSVNNNEAVRFQAPSVSSATLNRVVGALPSNINGLVQGNGQVFLINPNGILVGKSGAVNVQGGFVASTGNISDSAFMQGGTMLISGGQNNIKVLGTISAPGGDITLVAPAVAVDAGATLTAGSQINLVAADQVTLSNGRISVLPSATGQGNVTVAGTLQAAKVMLAAVNDNLGALAINTSGTVRATGVATNPDGSIDIVAIGGAAVQISGQLEAHNADSQGGKVMVGARDINLGNAALNVSGTQGGTVTLHADSAAGTVMVDGSSITAIGSEGTGGHVDVSGWHTGLTGNTVIDASGSIAGGTIRVGGDMHGQATDITNATGTFVGNNVVLKADGSQGNATAGKVVVWADDATNYYGHIDARGSGSGQGGNVEVSGHNTLNYQGSTDLRGGMAGGSAGNLLLDPTDLTIDAAGAATSTGYTGAPATTTFSGAGPTFNAASSHISWQDIDAALATSNVFINTNTGTATGTGNITITQGYAYNRPNTLTLRALNNFTVNSGATITNTGTGTLQLTSRGAMSINADITVAGTLQLQGAGGLAINTSKLEAGPNGTLVLNSTLDPYTYGDSALANNPNSTFGGNFLPWTTNYSNKPITFASGTVNPVRLRGGDVILTSGITGNVDFLPSSAVVEYGAGKTSFNHKLFVAGFANTEVRRWNTATNTVLPDVTLNPFTATALGDGIVYSAGGNLTVPTSLSVPAGAGSLVLNAVRNVVLQGNSYIGGTINGGNAGGELDIMAGAPSTGAQRNYTADTGTRQGAVQFAGTAPTILQGWNISVASGCNTAANCAASDHTAWDPATVLIHPNSATGQFGYLSIGGFKNTQVQDSAGPTVPLLAATQIYEVSADHLIVPQNISVAAGGTLWLEAAIPTGNPGDGYNRSGFLTFSQPNTILESSQMILYSGAGTSTTGSITTSTQATWQGSVAATEAQVPSFGRINFNTPTNAVQLRYPSPSNQFSNVYIRGFQDTRIDLLNNGGTTTSNLLNLSGTLNIYAGGNLILAQGATSPGVTKTLQMTGQTQLFAGYNFTSGNFDQFGVIKVLAPQPLWQISDINVFSGLGYDQTIGKVGRIDFSGGATGAATPSATDNLKDINSINGKPIILQVPASNAFTQMYLRGFGNVNLYAVSNATTPASLSWSGNLINGFNQTFALPIASGNDMVLYAANNINLFNQNFKIGTIGNTNGIDWQAGYNAYNYDVAVKPGKLTFMDPATLTARTNLAAFQPGARTSYIMVNNRGGDAGSANDLTNLTWDWTTGGIAYVPVNQNFNFYNFRNVTIQTVNNFPIVDFNASGAVRIEPLSTVATPALAGDINIIPNVYLTAPGGGYRLQGNSVNTQGILGTNAGSSASVSGNDSNIGPSLFVNVLHNSLLADGVTAGQTSSVINASADSSASATSTMVEAFVNLNLTALAGDATVNSRGLLHVTGFGNSTDTSNVTLRSQGDIRVGTNITRTGAGNISLQADANLNSIFAGYRAINPSYTGGNTDPRGFNSAGADGYGAVYANPNAGIVPQYASVVVANSNGTVPSGYVIYSMDGTALGVGSPVTAGQAYLQPGPTPPGFTALTSGGNQVYGVYRYAVGGYSSSTITQMASLGAGVAVGGVTPGTLTVGASDAGIVTDVAGQTNPIGTIVTGNTGSQGLGLSGQFYTSTGQTRSIPLAWAFSSNHVTISTGTGNLDIRSGYQYANSNGVHEAGDVADVRLGGSAVANLGLDNPIGLATWLTLGTVTGQIAVAGYRDIIVSDSNGITPSGGTAAVSLVANRDLNLLASIARAPNGSRLTLGAGNMITTSAGASVNADELQLVVGNGANITSSINKLSGEIIAPAANPTGLLAVGGSPYRGLSIGGTLSTGVLSVTNAKTLSVDTGFTNALISAFTFTPTGLSYPTPAPYGSVLLNPLNPSGLSVQTAGATLAGSINLGTTAGDILLNAPINVQNQAGITAGEVNLSAAANIVLNNTIADTDTAQDRNIFLRARNGSISHSGTVGVNTITGDNLTMLASANIGAVGVGNAIDTNVNNALFSSGINTYLYQSGSKALTAAGNAGGTVSVIDSQNTLTVGNFPTGSTPQTSLTAANTNNVFVSGLASVVGITTTGSNNISLIALGANSDVMSAARTYTPNGNITVSAGRNILDTLLDTNYGDLGFGTDTASSNKLAYSAGGTLNLNAVNTIGGDGVTTPNPLDVFFGNLGAIASGVQPLSGVYLTALDINPTGGVSIGSGVTAGKNIDITARTSTTASSGSLNVAAALATANAGYLRLAADRDVNLNAGVSADTSGNVVLMAGLSSNGNINQSASGTINSGSGEVNAHATGNINWNANVTTSGNILAQSNQAMTYGGTGSLNANTVILTSGTTIGTTASRVQTNTLNLAVANGGNAFVNNSGAATVAAASSNNANINLSTTNGTMTVGAVNVATVITPSTGNAQNFDNNLSHLALAPGANLTGVAANGSGTVVLAANGAGADVLINRNVSSGSNTIDIMASDDVIFNSPGVVQTGLGTTGVVTLTATGGRIIDNESASTPMVIGNTLNATAANGIGSIAAGPGATGDLATNVATLGVVITGTGNAVVQNSSALNVSGSVGNNTLNVGATGALTVTGPIAAAGGTVNLTSGMTTLGSTALSNNTGGVTLAANILANTLAINAAGLVQQTTGNLIATTTQVNATRFTTGSDATIANSNATLTESGSNVTGNYTIATQGVLNQSGTTTVGGNLSETGFTGGTVNGSVTVGGNYSGVNTYGGGGNITASSGSNSWINANAATTGVVVATGAGPDFDLSSANLGSGNAITVDLRSKTATVSGNQNAILLNGAGSSNSLGNVTLNTAKTVTVTTTLNDYDLVQTAGVNVSALTINAVAGLVTPTGLSNNGLGAINGINYTLHNNTLNGGQGSRIALLDGTNMIGALTINNADSAGIVSSGNIALNAVTMGGGLSVNSGGGAITQGSGNIKATTLDLTAVTGIGTAATPIRYDTASVVAATGAPGVLATSVLNVSGNTFVSATGAMQLGGNVNRVAFTCNSGASNLCNPLLTSSGITVTPVNVGNSTQGGNLTLTAGGAITTGNSMTTAVDGNIAISNTSGNITLNHVVSANGLGNVVLTAAADLLANASVTSTGGEINAKAANNVALGANVTTAGNVFIQALTRAITQSAGTVSGGGVALNAGTTIGTVANRIALNSNRLALTSAGNAFATEAGAVTVAGVTSANGNLDIQTQDGTLTVGAVTLTPLAATNAPGAALVGLSANNTGTVRLQANNGDLNVNNDVLSGRGEINGKANGGNVNLAANLSTGTTTSSNVFMEATDSINYVSGTISGNAAVLTADNSTIGASSAPGAVQTAVKILGVQSASDAFVNNAGVVTLAAQSSANGNLTLSTTNGTMTVGSVALTPSIAANAAGLNFNGVAANGSGMVALTAGGTTSDVLVNQSVSSGSNTIDITAGDDITFANTAVAQTGLGATGIVSLTATSGQIINNEAANAPVVVGNALHATAAKGIGTAATGPGSAGNLATQVATLEVALTGIGNAMVQNSGALNVNGSVGANIMNVGATGAITVNGPIAAAGGTLDLISGMTALGSTGLSNDTGGITLADNITADTLTINAAGLVRQTAGLINTTITTVDTTRYTTGNSATLSNDTSTLTETGSNIAGNYTILTQGTLDQVGNTSVGGNLTETGATGGTVNGNVTVGGNYSGVNQLSGAGNISAMGSNSTVNVNAAATGVVVANGAAPDFDLSSVNLTGTALSNITVNLRSKAATVTGAQDAVLLNAGANSLGKVTVTTATAPVTVSIGEQDYDLVQTAALTMPTTTRLTINAVAGASTATSLQNNTLGTIGGVNYNNHDNLLNGGQGSRIVLDNAANTLAGITINNADAANIAVNGNLNLGSITLAHSLVASSSTGAITQSTGSNIKAAALALNAVSGIGATGAPIRFDTAAAIAAGETPVLATSESGNGSTAVATSGAVQLGGNINVVGFSLINSNLSGRNTSGTFLTPTLMNNSANTGEINLLSNGSATLSADVITGGNTFIQATSGDITQLAGKLTAARAVLTANAGNIGSSTTPIATHVDTLGLSAQSDANVVNDDAIILGAVTNSNGDIDVRTLDGTLTVAAINVQPTLTGNAIGLTRSGVSANGSGTVTLTAGGAASDVLINRGVSSGSNTIDITAGNNIVFNNPAVVQTGPGATGVVSLTATSGQIINNQVASTPVVVGNTLHATAANGIGAAATASGNAGDLATNVATLAVMMTGTGNAVVQNSGALNLSASVGANALQVGATRAITVAAIAADGGTVDLTSGMTAMGSTALSTNTGGVTLTDDVTANSITINAAGLVQQTAGVMSTATTMVDTTRYTTGNSATLLNGTAALTENGSDVGGNYTITTQGGLEQSGITMVGANLTETGFVGGTVNGNITAGGNYSGVNIWAPGGSVTAGGANSSANANAATTGVVVADGAGPDFDLSSVNLGSAQNLTVNLRNMTVNSVTGAVDAVLLNGSVNTLGSVTIKTAKSPVTLSKTSTDYNLIQTAALVSPQPVNLTINAVAGASTATALQNNTLGTISGNSYDSHDNLLNGGQGSRIVLDNAANTLAGITINNADAANIAANGNLNLGSVTLAHSLMASSSTGAITQSTGSNIKAAALALNALSGIGTTGAPIRFDTAAAIAAGETPVLTTSESGNGSTAVATSGAVQLGGNINIVGFSSGAAEGSSGTFLTSTAGSNTADTGELNLLSNGSMTLVADVNTNGNAFIESTQGNMTQSGGKISAAQAVLTADAGSIGTTSTPISTQVTRLGLHAQNDVRVVNDEALILGAVTDNNGAIDVRTVSGSLTVSAIDMQPTMASNAIGLTRTGVSANGNGNVILQANNGDLQLDADVASGGGELNLKSISGDVNLGANLNTTGNVFLQAANSIARTTGTITAFGAVLTADNGAIGSNSTTGTIHTALHTLGITSAGDGFINNAGAMTVAGQSQGTLTLSTDSGQLTVASVTLIPSIASNAVGLAQNSLMTTGDLSLSAAPTTNGVLEIDVPVNVGGAMMGVAGVDVNIHNNVTANGQMTFVTDAASGSEPGPGWFRNTSSISSTNAGVAIYAVAGGVAPDGYITDAVNQMQLGSVSGMSNASAPVSRWSSPYPSSTYSPEFNAGSGMFYKAALVFQPTPPQPISVPLSPIPTPQPTPQPISTTPLPPSIPVVSPEVPQMASTSLIAILIPPAQTATAEMQNASGFSIDMSALCDPSQPWSLGDGAMPYGQETFQASLSINGNYAPPRFTFGMTPSSMSGCGKGAKSTKIDVKQFELRASLAP